jgi:hypothetical protein
MSSRLRGRCHRLWCQVNPCVTCTANRSAPTTAVSRAQTRMMRVVAMVAPAGAGRATVAARGATPRAGLGIWGDGMDTPYSWVATRRCSHPSKFMSVQKGCDLKPIDTTNRPPLFFSLQQKQQESGRLSRSIRQLWRVGFSAPPGWTSGTRMAIGMDARVAGEGPGCKGVRRTTARTAACLSHLRCLSRRTLPRVHHTHGVCSAMTSSQRRPSSQTRR